jgi:hypothetical protein
MVGLLNSRSEVGSQMNATQVSIPNRSIDRSAGRWFYAFMAAVAVGISIVAFAPSIAYPAGRLGPLTPLAMIHGFVFFAWLMVFLTQTILVETRKIDIHRTLGTASMVLAAGMIVVGYETTVALARRGYDLSGDLGGKPGAGGLNVLGQMIFPLSDIFMFAVLIAAGYIYRRRAAAHKRLMLFATLTLMPAPFGHLIGHFAVLRSHSLIIVPLIAISLGLSAVYDRIFLGRIHPLSLWLAISIFVIDNVCAVVAPSAAWQQIAGWLAS